MNQVNITGTIAGKTQIGKSRNGTLYCILTVRNKRRTRTGAMYEFSIPVAAWNQLAADVHAVAADNMRVEIIGYIDWNDAKKTMIVTAERVEFPDVDLHAGRAVDERQIGAYARMLRDRLDAESILMRISRKTVTDPQTVVRVVDLVFDNLARCAAADGSVADQLTPEFVDGILRLIMPFDPERDRRDIRPGIGNVPSYVAATVRNAVIHLDA